MSNTICQTCNMCCKLLGVAALEKPAVVWCEYCDKGKIGCTIYATRPTDCRTYECVYRGDPIPALRPDRCYVIIDASLDGSEHYVRVDPQRNLKAWRNQTVLNFILPLFDHWKVWLVSGDQRREMRRTNPLTIVIERSAT